MGARVKSTHGALLQKDRGSSGMLNFEARRLARLHLKMPQFARRLGTLADLHLHRGLET